MAVARRAKEKEIIIERDGCASKVSGFQTGFTSDKPDPITNLVFNERGVLRLPTRTDQGAASANLPENTRRREQQPTIESLFVTCKAFSTIPALQQIRHRLRPQSTVVLCQNGGLGVYEQLLYQVFPNPDERPHFVLVSNTHGAFLRHPPMHIVHAGVGALRYGIVPDGRRDFEKSLSDANIRPALRRLNVDDIVSDEEDPLRDHYLSLRNTITVLQSLSELHPQWESYDRLQTTLRQKLVVNSVVNPITMLMGCRNGELYGNPSIDRLIVKICSEATSVFEAEAKARAMLNGTEVVPIPQELKTKNLVDECRRVIKLTAGNISSMLADQRRGHTDTEIDFFNGYLLGLGRRHNLFMPVNSTVVDMVKIRSSIPIDSKL
ncbi:hypothetical protein SCHPADRAFT_902792 [Schizopora paradoxa]|uniref:2-dehydropantoate 2-reductase n=1 Tax=Schizopora paradoxa TaxID=27342 RepID=A0A0H2S015_9AGAM|nr:hypothetical protein SCHPADRAFT_902792 [Schizopora paradoxa]